MDLLITTLLAMGSVSLWTLRLAVTTRGLRLVAVPLAAIEAVVYVTAFGQVLADLDALDRRMAFGVGVAAGTYLAMCVADRIADGHGADDGPGRRQRGARRLHAGRGG